MKNQGPVIWVAWFLGWVKGIELKFLLEKGGEGKGGRKREEGREGNSEEKSKSVGGDPGRGSCGKELYQAFQVELGLVQGLWGL